MPPSPPAGAPSVVDCPTCKKATALCVCALLRPMPTRHAVLVLQHPQEDGHALGTVPLLARGLQDVTVRVGLSWASLGQALKDEAQARRWALVFPAPTKGGARPARAPTSSTAPTPRAVAPVAAATAGSGVRWSDAKGRQVGAPRRLAGIILLDGTWSQAKSLLWRNPWLIKLVRLELTSSEPSIYGRLRREPRPQWRSTLEAAVAALAALGEPPPTLQPLLRGLRTLAQRLRDSTEVPATRRRRLPQGGPPIDGARRRKRRAPRVQEKVTSTSERQTINSVQDGASAPALSGETATHPSPSHAGRPRAAGAGQPPRHL